MTCFTQSLRITEIFHSLQGESLYTGLPTVFIRLTGCPLRCTYCDTTYAFNGGQRLSFEEILTTTAQFDCPYVCITGGEPLAQPGTLALMTTLCDQGYQVSLETSGAFDISLIDPRVMIVMDLKTPASGEASKNLLANLSAIKPKDQIKFVICNEDDYFWACNLLKEYQLTERSHVLFSPSYNELKSNTLATWIIRDKLRVRFQLQLHKILEIA